MFDDAEFAVLSGIWGAEYIIEHLMAWAVQHDDEECGNTLRLESHSQEKSLL